MSEIRVDNITNEAGTGRPAFTNGVQTSNINGGQVGGRRNLIINGAMQVAQRGTSVTGKTSTDYYTVDRWFQVGSGGTFNSSQEELPLGQTDIPGQFKYFQRFEVTTGNNNASIVQRIEDVTRFDDVTVTISFYAKGSNPGGGSLQFLIDQAFGSGGSTAVSFTESFTLTTSWQRFVITKQLPSLAGKTVGDNSFVSVQFKQPSGDSSTDAWTLDITGVQLEVGDTATEFEHRSFGEELSLCQRYYQKLGGTGSTVRLGSAHYETSTAVRGVIPFKVTMRAPPSASATGNTRFFTTSGRTYETQVGAADIQMGRWTGNTTTSGTAGDAGFVDTAVDSSAFIEFDAEL